MPIPGRGSTASNQTRKTASAPSRLSPPSQARKHTIAHKCTSHHLLRPTDSLQPSPETPATTTLGHMVVFLVLRDCHGVLPVDISVTSQLGWCKDVVDSAFVSSRLRSNISRGSHPLVLPTKCLPASNYEHVPGVLLYSILSPSHRKSDLLP